MLRYLKLLFATAVISSTVSCSKSSTTPAPSNLVNFAATLNGASESTPNASTATGSSTASYNTTTKILTISTTYTGITATAAHIHQGAVGVSGPVIFGFTTLASPIDYTSAALDATQEGVLMSNGYYVNIHSGAYPGGEIRGQLNKQ